MDSSLSGSSQTIRDARHGSITKPNASDQRNTVNPRRVTIFFCPVFSTYFFLFVCFLHFQGFFFLCYVFRICWIIIFTYYCSPPKPPIMQQLNA